MQAATGDVSVYRPSEYRVGEPAYRNEVAESCLNRYQLIVEPLSFTEQRCSFSWRSPGIGSICSPNVYLETQWVVKAPGRLDLPNIKGPMYGYVDCTTVAVAANKAAEVGRIGQLPKICFGSGDAFGRAIENYQITINGQSVSNPRMSTYKQVLDRTWYSEETFVKRFSSCGGRQDQYDSVCVSGEAHNRAAGNVAPDAAIIKAANNTRLGIPAVSAFTGDSGINSRVDGLMGCLTELPAPAIGAADERHFVAADQDCRVFTVRWCLNGVGVFSPITARDEVSHTCPYRYSMLAIPHMSVVQVDILFESLRECIFRNLSSLGGGGGNLGSNVGQSGFQVALSTRVKPTLHVEYLRLSSWRPQPERVELQTFRIAVHNPTKTDDGAPAIPATLTRADQGALGRGSGGCETVACMGTDRQAAQNRSAQFSQNGALTATWSGIVSSQAPAYLCFCMQKSAKQFILGGSDATDNPHDKGIAEWQYAGPAPLRAAGLAPTRGEIGGLENYFLCRNTDSAAAVLQLELQVQSSVGSYSFSGDTFPFNRTKNRLWRDTIKNCVDGYCGGDIEKWHKHQCILVIAASDYMRGLASPGVAYPITLNAEVKFASRREYIDGTGGVSSLSVGTPVFQDKIAGVPVMLQIFPQQRLQLSASSGLLSSQNLSHAQAQQILSQY